MTNNDQGWERITTVRLQEMKERESLLVKALIALMRPDGHYLECPVTGEDSDDWGKGHKHMSINPTVALCEQLRKALKGEET